MTVADISHRKRFLAGGNVYLPHIAVIEKVIDETPGVRTFHFNFKDEKLREEFTFESGQFGEYSIFGVGEAPFCISSSPTRRDQHSNSNQTPKKPHIHSIRPSAETELYQDQRRSDTS